MEALLQRLTHELMKLNGLVSTRPRRWRKLVGVSLATLEGMCCSCQSRLEREQLFVGGRARDPVTLQIQIVTELMMVDGRLDRLPRENVHYPRHNATLIL